LIVQRTSIAGDLDKAGTLGPGRLSVDGGQSAGAICPKRASSPVGVDAMALVDATACADLPASRWRIRVYRGRVNIGAPA